MNLPSRRIAGATVGLILAVVLIFAWVNKDNSAPPFSDIALNEVATAENPALSRSEGDDADGVVVLNLPAADSRVVGDAFVDALASILGEELSSFWGWRPNDLGLIGPGWWTDNVNNIQLGKLEVTRQSCRILKTRMARFNDTDAFNRDLEQAESAFFNDAQKWMLPSAEKKFREGVVSVEAYRASLATGNATFHPRSDHLYDLLGYYKDILGSCHALLVRQQEVDGSAVSMFRTDDYFYYSLGVVQALHALSQATLVDFREELDSRSLAALTQQALASLARGAVVEPCLVTNGDADGILANHRLNLAGYVADARQKLHSVRETLKK